MKDYIYEYPKEKENYYNKKNISLNNINNSSKEKLEKWGRKDITMKLN